MCFQQQIFKVKLHSHYFIHFVREFPANILPFAPRNWPSQKEKWSSNHPFCERPIWNFRICTTSSDNFSGKLFFCVCPLPFSYPSLEPEIPIALENRTNQINFSSSTMNLQYLRTVRRHSWEQKLPTPSGRLNFRENQLVGRCSPQVVWGGSFISPPQKMLKSPPILLLGLKNLWIRMENEEGTYKTLACCSFLPGCF